METIKTDTRLILEKETDSLNNCNEISRNSDSSEKIKNVDTAKLRTCSFFYNNGFCKFGNKCRYKHLKRNSVNNEQFIKNRKASGSQKGHKDLERENILSDSNNLASSRQICKYYMLGDCKKGDNCEYLHSVDLVGSEMTSLTLSSKSKDIPRKVFSSSSNKSKKKTLCYYFKKGYCYKGDSCKYYHSPKNHLESPDNNSLDRKNDNDKNVKSVSENFFANKRSSNFRRIFNVYDLFSLTTDDITELRATEISQLKKRFPSFEIINENQTYSVLFQPSDPDWAFDVKKLKLEVEFPEKYPTENCKISVIHSVENIPLLLIKHLNSAISQWIGKKFEENYAANKTELIFRPFLRWFDKNVEDLFIAGLRKVKQDLLAKEAGIEFVPVENLFPSSEKADAEESHEIEASSNFLQFEEQMSTVEIKHSPPEISENNKPTHYNGTDGMKIIFTNLELIEGAGAFTCTKISVTLQCCRCKTFFNMKSVPKKNNSHICTKCSKIVGFVFESATVHQFSSVLGSLHLLDCVAVDINLVECHFLIDCLNCSKQVPVEGIHYGQKHKMWCTFCSEKIIMTVGAVKFQSLKLTSVPVTKYPIPKKTEKKIKDPLIKEGEPLPNFGACKHYKKSFRWLRFPCCGRLYPCDECHNEKETDHEMKYASRMICGFCAKEQPYSQEKPCLLCSQSLTKKSGSHWEGGKGCRNKILMCREDKQKYAGTNKTISKKAQSTKTKKKH